MRRDLSNSLSVFGDTGESRPPAGESKLRWAVNPAAGSGEKAALEDTSAKAGRSGEGALSVTTATFDRGSGPARTMRGSGLSAWNGARCNTSAGKLRGAIFTGVRSIVVVCFAVVRNVMRACLLSRSAARCRCGAKGCAKRQRLDIKKPVALLYYFISSLYPRPSSKRKETRQTFCSGLRAHCLPLEPHCPLLTYFFSPQNSCSLHQKQRGCLLVMIGAPEEQDRFCTKFLDNPFQPTAEETHSPLIIPQVSVCPPFLLPHPNTFPSLSTKRAAVSSV